MNLEFRVQEIAIVLTINACNQDMISKMLKNVFV